MTTPFDPNAYFNSDQLISSAGSGVRAPSLGASPYSNARVYMGSGGTGGQVGNTMDPTGATKVGGKLVGSQGRYLGYEDARLLPTTWSDSELKSFVNKGILYKLPGFGANMGMPEIVSAWDDIVKAAMTFSKPGQEWTPQDVMDSYAVDGKFGTIRKGDWLYDAQTGEKVKYVGPRTKTTTSKRVDLSSPEDVRALTTQMLTELLGRAPTSEELAKYRSSISGLEKASPEVTKTTTTLNDMGEEVAQSSTTSGGVSDAARAGLITEAAKEGPEYGKFQGATTYFNAMMQMLGG